MREGFEFSAGHVDDEGGLVGKRSRPAGCQGQFAVGVMGCGEDEFRGSAPVGQRRLERGGDGERGGDSGDDLEWDGVLAKEGDLFGGATEDQGVA